MKREDATVGTWVRTLRAFVSLPRGTVGVIDYDYGDGVMVAWDLPEQPLPEGYEEYDGQPAIKSNILRDGFAWNELHTLAVYDGEEAKWLR